MAKSIACGDELNMNDSHNWRCENDECPRYHTGHRDMQEEVEGGWNPRCHGCNARGFWRGDVYKCEECGRAWL